jgi:hypothetical protein
VGRGGGTRSSLLSLAPSLSPSFGHARTRTESFPRSISMARERAEASAQDLSTRGALAALVVASAVVDSS